MQVFKFILLMVIWGLSSTIGVLVSKKYSNRVKELKEIKNALNILETKIKFTYKPLPEIFDEIEKSMSDNISSIFKSASNKLQTVSAKEAWEYGIDNANLNLKQEDISIIKDLGKLLRKNRYRGTS